MLKSVSSVDERHAADKARRADCKSQASEMNGTNVFYPRGSEKYVDV